MSTIEDAIRAALAAELVPLRAEVRALRGEMEALRGALPPVLVPLPEAAKLTGLSLSTLRRRIEDGTLSVQRIGRAIRVDLAALRHVGSDEVARLAADARGATGGA